MNALEVKQLTQSFGDKKVLQEVSFTVPEGAVFGFLGKNGAGKTTTMKIILGLLKAQAGTVTVFGEKVNYGQNATNRLIGYLPDVPEFYDFMSAPEYLKLCGKITKMPAEKIKQRSAELLTLVGLENSKQRIGSFSRGMKQRLGIAQALLNEPKLLICDEPTSALDPIGRKEILDILAKIKQRITVVFSTHILTDVDKICDHLAILDQGKIVMTGAINQLKETKRQETILLEFANQKDQQQFSALAQAENYQCEVIAENTNQLTTTQANQLTLDLMKELSAKQLTPIKLEIKEPSLEDLFLEVVQ